VKDPTLDRLAHSVLWPGFTGRRPPRWLAEAMGHGLAGVVYFAANIDPADPAQLRGLSDELHGLNPDALLGVDEEGGIVSRLEAAAGSSTPGNAVLGRLDDEDASYRVGRWTGQLVRANGIDVDLAPSVDVNNNASNPVIGVRSFGSDPALVARHGAAWIRGLHSAGVAACAKHFPGHGDTSTDSHLAPATADISLDELRSVHLPPFEAAVRVGAGMVMTAHITVPALGPAPATTNPAALKLLRDLGFDGVICTDALDMAAIRTTLGIGRGAVAALAAGADLLCVGNPNINASTADGRDESDFNEPLAAVYEALKSGDLPVERVQQAADRTAALVSWCRAQQPPDGSPAIDGIGLAERAMVSHGHVQLRGGSVLVIDGRLRRNVAVDDAPDAFTTELRRHRQVERVGLSGMSPADAELAVRTALARASTNCDVVLLTGQPQSSPNESHILDVVRSVRPQTVVIYTGWPPPAAPTDNALLTYGASRVSAAAAVRALLPV
jgi:beta-N-acetylhexosaminidase